MQQVAFRVRWSVLALLAAAGLGCEGAATCGPGTVIDADGICVAAPPVECGPGTVKTAAGCVSASNAGGADAVAQEDSAAAETAQSSDAAQPTDAAEPADSVDPGDDAIASDIAVCAPECAGKVCGPDGCGGLCGVCEAGKVCGAEGSCTACTPACQGKQCGPDGCGGSCGDCAFVAGKPFCGANGQCAEKCEPNCVDNQCGPDGCGGVCGNCGVGEHCVLHQCDKLDPAASCDGNCGKAAASGCGCQAGCSGDACCGDFKAACPCIPECTGKDCGSDGCGGSCGNCPAGSNCQAEKCIDDPCDPDPCNGHGSCNAGVCTCAAPFDGPACDKCLPPLQGYPSCQPDVCAGQDCSGKGTCDPKTGACVCAAGFGGSTCGQCKFATHVWPDCKAAPCDGVQCNSGVCLADSGECLCKPGFGGGACSTCDDPSQKYPACTSPTANYLPGSALAGLDCPFCAPALDKYDKPANPTDTTPPSILVSVPPAGAVISPGAPLMLVIADVIDGKTVTPTTLKLVPKGAPSASISGVVRLQATASGQSVLMFFPTGILASGSYELVTDGLKDTGGNALPKHVLEVKFDGAVAGKYFGDNLGFDKAQQGCYFAGDAGSGIAASDNVGPSDGSGLLGLSTGSGKFGGSALNGFGSVAVCGPVLIPAGKTKLTFDYRFASEEFDDYVGQGFDDFAVVALSGFAGGSGGVLTSVNAVGPGQTQTKAYGTGSEGDSQCKVTAWKSATVSNIGALGGYAILTFAVTDVADDQMSSLFMLDNLRFE